MPNIFGGAGGGTDLMNPDFKPHKSQANSQDFRQLDVRLSLQGKSSWGLHLSQDHVLVQTSPVSCGIECSFPGF
jgi:hypothetical protein